MNHYELLLGLRAIQSLSASAAYAISFGVVADVCVPSERGRMLGPVSIALNLGACIGPVLGNGKKRASLQKWERTWLRIVMWLTTFDLPGKPGRRAPGTDQGLSEGGLEKEETSASPKLLSRLQVGNPLTCLGIIFHLDTFFVLWMHGSFYTVDFSLVAALPDIYKQIYHFNELQIGLRFERVSGQARPSPRQRLAVARFHVRPHWIRLGCTLSCPRINLADMQFMQGFWGTCFYTIYNTFLVDVFPQSPSTAAAASITRCAIAAAGVAVLQPQLDATGRGWYFTVLGLWSGSFGGAVLWCIKKEQRDGLEKAATG
ncbi:uncharacterized protein Z519_10826 [Cladophialophora bantiana CBS 173.52]|uniref:Major facilitator superfamily (MFS) profile domain-containing protein n=1 Tax=Cladophialophora bantiana (strain ATCC 10958 / CBS 173.52 / CDC B-1940 / NIH 8579) TaxID=1442370 RepID=A0A0D2HW18_CLAB1|nr:uncharacterized protein Z519_10826 [Cladophialophora bantiana CBS 173.52]KIW88779.1 hypothetical protein Z519_10826 [Cladophialophora bantiana CBS 173.52]